MFTFIKESKYTLWAAWMCAAMLFSACEQSNDSDSTPLDAMVATDMGVTTTDLGGIELVTFDTASGDDLVFQPISNETIEAIWSLSGTRILWRTELGYFLFERGESREVAPASMAIHDAIFVQNQLLVTTDNGLMVLEGDTFVPSPLNDALTGTPRFVAIDDDAFWLIDASSIKHWRDGRLTTSQLTGDRLEGLTLFARQVGDGDELLIWEGMTARSIVFKSGVFSETRFGFRAFPTAVALNQKALWVLDAERLYWRTNDETWFFAELPNSMHSLHSNNQSAIVYLLDERHIWRLEGTVLSPADKPTAIHSIQTNDRDGLLMIEDSLLQELNAGLTAVLNAPPPGPLVSAHTISAQLNITEGLEAVQWRLDNEVIAQDVLEFELNPMSILPGPHVLEFSAQLSPDRRVTTQLEFNGPPSWSAFIEPISEDYCVACHGDDARVQLLTVSNWVETFDLILYDVETGRMPPTADKLTPSQVDLIRGWGAAGFPIGGDR